MTFLNNRTKLILFNEYQDSIKKKNKYKKQNES